MIKSEEKKAIRECIVKANLSLHLNRIEGLIESLRAAESLASAIPLPIKQLCLNDAQPEQSTTRLPHGSDSDAGK